MTPSLSQANTRTSELKWFSLETMRSQWLGRGYTITSSPSSFSAASLGSGSYTTTSWSSSTSPSLSSSSSSSGVGQWFLHNTRHLSVEKQRQLKKKEWLGPPQFGQHHQHHHHHHHYHHQHHYNHIFIATNTIITTKIIIITLLSPPRPLSSSEGVVWSAALPTPSS